MIRLPVTRARGAAGRVDTAALPNRKFRRVDMIRNTVLANHYLDYLAGSTVPSQLLPQSALEGAKAFGRAAARSSSATKPTTVKIRRSLSTWSRACFAAKGSRPATCRISPRDGLFPPFPLASELPPARDR